MNLSSNYAFSTLVNDMLFEEDNFSFKYEQERRAQMSTNIFGKIGPDMPRNKT